MKEGLVIHPLPHAALDSERWAAALRPAGGLVFFDSALAHETLGRYSFIMADPFHRLTADGDRVSLDGAPISGDPFTALADLMARYRQARVPDLPPFQGGVAGSFGYGLRHHVERVPRHRRDDQDIPDLLLGAYDLVVAIDHVAGTGWLISSGLPANGAARQQRAEARIAWALDLFARAGDVPSGSQWAIAARPEISGADYKAMVGKTIAP